jgi:hypothetical protein
MLLQEALVFILRLVHGLDLGPPFLEIDLISFPDAKFL